MAKHPAKFKEGDYVKCVQGHSTELITGRMYRIEKINTSIIFGLDGIKVYGVSRTAWLKDRFHLLTKEDLAKLTSLQKFFIGGES